MLQTRPLSYYLYFLLVQMYMLPVDIIKNYQRHHITPNVLISGRMDVLENQVKKVGIHVLSAI